MPLSPVADIILCLVNFSLYLPCVKVDYVLFSVSNTSKIYEFCHLTTVFPLFKDAHIFPASLSWFLIFCDSRMFWWHEQGEKLEVCGSEQEDPAGWTVYFPNFEGPYQCSIWIANKNTGKYDPGRKWGWRWGSGFEVFVSLPCPELKFSFTFKFTVQFLSQVRWNWDVLWLLLYGSWISSSILHRWKWK